MSLLVLCAECGHAVSTDDATPVEGGHLCPECVPACEMCGCTDDHACTDDDGNPCHWVTPGLCSVCATSIDPPAFEDRP